MNLIHHKNLGPNRWFAESLSWQMANIGSEVHRTISWREKGNNEYANLAFERALELIDLTIEDPKNRRRSREILKFRELFTDWYLGEGNYIVSGESLDKYFLPFTFAARLGR
ncbi:MAG: hypothetical protein AAB360_02550 [Patescibacteria group bacterium]